MIENFHLDLPAVGMSGQAKLDPHLRSARKRIRIVRKQNIRNVFANQRFDQSQHRMHLAECRTLALVIHADQIEFGVVPGDFNAFLAQQIHTVLREKALRLGFHVGINFVVAVAAPHPQRRVQLAQLSDAILQRIVRRGDEIAGHHDNVAAQRTGHPHRPAQFAQRKKIAQVDVAQLHDAQPIQTGRQGRNGNFNASNPVLQPFPEKSVRSHHNRRGAHQVAGIPEKFAARRIESFTAARLDGSERAGGKQVRRMDNLYSRKSKKGNDEPEFSTRQNPGGCSLARKKSRHGRIEDDHNYETDRENPYAL